MATEQSDSEALLLGILALLAEDRRVRGDDNPKTEVLLAEAGLPIPLVARIVRKQPEAVRKAVSRAKGRITGETG